METIEDKITNFEAYGGWSHRYYLVCENNKILQKITKTKMISGDLSSLKNISPRQKCQIINVDVRTENRIPRILYDVNTIHITLDENKRFNTDFNRVFPSSNTSMLHINLVMKDLFKKSDYGYLSLRMAMQSPLIREIKISDIDQIIPLCIQYDKPTSLDDKIKYANKVIDCEGLAGNSFNYLVELHQMYLREIENGLIIDKAIFTQILDSLENNKIAATHH